jgi:excisionase family DNA binding protein
MTNVMTEQPSEQVRRVERQITALRRSGRMEDAAALRFVLRCAKKSLAPSLRETDRPMLTTGEAATRLGVSDETVRSWVKRGILKAERRGSRRMIAEADVERELAESGRFTSPRQAHRLMVGRVRSLGVEQPQDRLGYVPAPGYAEVVADREPIRPVPSRRTAIAVRRVGRQSPQVRERAARGDD